jgi:GST-like protein
MARPVPEPHSASDGEGAGEAPRIDLYFWPTPNTRKVAIFLEEAGLPYRTVLVDITSGDQHDPAFRVISPNGRIPALVDRRNDPPVQIFESCAILLHLAEADGRFMPTDPQGRAAVSQWLFWQAAGLGPMAGQLSHFVNYAPSENVYSRERYASEYDRLLSVMDGQLQREPFLAGAYSIADMACFPWVLTYRALEASLEGKPGLRRWFDLMKARPAVRRAVELGSDLAERRPKLSKDARKVLFGQ